MSKKSFSRRYQSEYNLYKMIVQLWAIYFVCMPFWSLFYKIKVEGKENIPKGQKVILAGNHISYFDPFLLFLATLRPVAFMAKKELFARGEKPGFLHWFLYSWRVAWLDRLGAFSVNREKLEVSTIKTARDILQTKHWTLGIFPQGGIRKNHKIEFVNKGFAVLAKMVKVDILPVGITGCENYSWDFKNKKQITVRIGKPISAQLEIDEIRDRWAKSVAELCEYEYAPTEEKEPAKV